MTYRYEIDSENAVRIWDLDNPNENNEPFFYQPEWPNGTKWANKSEAESWAKAFINELEDLSSAFVAGDGPDEPLKPRPVAEPAIEDVNVVDEEVTA